jgi:hypothetical protein
MQIMEFFHWVDQPQFHLISSFLTSKKGLLANLEVAKSDQEEEKNAHCQPPNRQALAFCVCCVQRHV